MLDCKFLVAGRCLSAETLLTKTLQLADPVKVMTSQSACATCQSTWHDGDPPDVDSHNHVTASLACVAAKQLGADAYDVMTSATRDLRSPSAIADKRVSRVYAADTNTGEGVGDVFKRLLEERWRGIHSCEACEELRALMNARGPQGCRDSMAEIVADILPRMPNWVINRVVNADFAALWSALTESRSVGGRAALIESLVNEAISLVEAGSDHAPFLDSFQSGARSPVAAERRDKQRRSAAAALDDDDDKRADFLARRECETTPASKGVGTELAAVRQAAISARPSQRPRFCNDEMLNRAAVAIADGWSHGETANIVALVPLFNPLGYRRRVSNYDRVIEHLRKHGFRHVLTVEAIYPGQSPQSTGDAIVVKATERQVLWQKERLLNIGLDSLRENPPEAVAWIDADLLWDRPVASLTLDALRTHDVVQPFRTLTIHEEDLTIESVRRAQYSDVDPAIPQHCGMAWAARWDVVSGGLYDAEILGFGDRSMLEAWEHDDSRTKFTPQWKSHWKSWWPARPLSIGCINAHVCHLWHGTQVDRRYGEARKLLIKHGFDPVRDIRIGQNGLWEWTGANPVLNSAVVEHLQVRREDGGWFIHSALPEFVVT